MIWLLIYIIGLMAMLAVLSFRAANVNDIEIVNDIESDNIVFVSLFWPITGPYGLLQMLSRAITRWAGRYRVRRKN